MPSVIKTVTWDCSDALALARFWAAALGSDVDEGLHAGQGICRGRWLGRPQHVVQPGAEPKTAKNRLHFDLRAPGDMAEEVARLQALGATVIRRGDAITVMLDPEGNEFCVEPGPK